MNYKDRKRHKAWLGAIIGGVLGIGSSIASGVIGNNKQKTAEEEAKKEQERAEQYKTTAGIANSINEQLATKRDYQESFRNQYYRLGGRCKKKCGGKTKADLGTEIGAAISGASGGISSLVTALTSNPSYGQAAASVGNFVQGTINARDKEKLTDRQIAANKANDINTLLAMRYGGRKKCRCGGKKK